MSQISKLYSSIYSRYDVTRKDKNKPKDKLNYCVCFYCSTRKITKRLSKSDRKKFKRRNHPICTECRTTLNKSGLYSRIIQDYLSK